MYTHVCRRRCTYWCQSPTICCEPAYNHASKVLKRPSTATMHQHNAAIRLCLSPPSLPLTAAIRAPLQWPMQWPPLSLPLLVPPPLPVATAVVATAAHCCCPLLFAPAPPPSP